MTSKWNRSELEQQSQRNANQTCANPQFLTPRRLLSRDHFRVGGWAMWRWVGGWCGGGGGFEAWARADFIWNKSRDKHALRHPILENQSIPNAALNHKKNTLSACFVRQRGDRACCNKIKMHRRHAAAAAAAGATDRRSRNDMAICILQDIRNTE